MAEVQCLRVANWETNFENNRTRGLKSLTWVPVPNKLDGDGYTEIVEHKDGASHYAAWTTLVLVASRCHPRGTLLRACSRPHDSVSLARISRLPAKLFNEAIPRLIDVGWLETVVVAVPDVTTTPHESAVSRHESAVIPHHPALNGREGNIYRDRFKKPSIDEVKAYCKERQNHIDPEAFIAHYESNGWKVGKNKMKDWKAAVRTWEAKRREEQPVTPRLPTQEEKDAWMP